MKDYSVEVQKLFLEFMMQDAQSYVRVQNIFNEENFDRSLRSAAKFIREHCDQPSLMFALRVVVVPSTAQSGHIVLQRLQQMPHVPHSCICFEADQRQHATNRRQLFMSPGQWSCVQGGILRWQRERLLACH